MSLNKLTLALSLALFALPMAAMAQDAAEETAAEEAPAAEEAESNFSWNLSFTSDYVFRGVSQNLREPAVQAGMDYSFGDTGFYVGTWGSNVDFGAGGPDLEVDTYIGWNHDISDDWNFDLMLTRYNYLGANNAYGNINYNELIGVVTWSEMIAATLAYTDDYSNSGISSTYFSVTGTWEIGNEFSLNAGAGVTSFEGGGDYNDWNLGISRQFGPVNAAINYYDTDIAGPQVSDGFVLTFAFGG